MRNRIRAPLTDHARELIAAKLTKWHGEGLDTVAALNQSIERDWRGVWPIEHDHNALPRQPGSGYVDTRTPEQIAGDNAENERLALEMKAQDRKEYQEWQGKPDAYRKAHPWKREIPQ